MSYRQFCPEAQEHIICLLVITGLLQGFLSEISKIYTALCWLKDKQLEVLSPDGINKAIYVYLMNRSLFALSESKSQAAARDQARKNLVCNEGLHTNL